MLVTVIGLIRFASSLLFGTWISVLFAGIKPTRKNDIAVRCSCVILLLVQSACWLFFGLEMTSKLYPLIIHLPQILFLTLYFKRPWLISIVSVLSAYLCCQAPRWLGVFAGTAFQSLPAEHISYITAVILAYFFLKKYVAGSVFRLMEKSKSSCILLGAIPLFYYIFDYFTIIFTDLLYSGAKWAVLFIPSIVSVFYFVFVILYYDETQKQAAAQRERDMLESQLNIAKTEFDALRSLQECTTLYRHDMRHHFSFLQGLAAEGSIDRIKDYLSAAEQDMDAITPLRFSENETLNLILSSFAAKAKQAEVSLSIDAKLPKDLPLSDTELCSLLSNGLENAIAAAAATPDSKRKTVTVKAVVHKNKLLISMENAYSGEIIMKDGAPLSMAEGHGYGTRSIAAITNAHGGQAIFSAEGGVFTLKVMLPL